MFVIPTAASIASVAAVTSASNPPVTTTTSAAPLSLVSSTTRCLTLPTIVVPGGSVSCASFSFIELLLQLADTPTFIFIMAAVVTVDTAHGSEYMTPLI